MVNIELDQKIRIDYQVGKHRRQEKYIFYLYFSYCNTKFLQDMISDSHLYIRGLQDIVWLSISCLILQGYIPSLKGLICAMASLFARTKRFSWTTLLLLLELFTIVLHTAGWSLSLVSLPYVSIPFISTIGNTSDIFLLTLVIIG